jgi:uncharacterized protein with NRDE domain
MCLILFAWRAHPEFPCVLAANRDEFHARPSAPADWWPDEAGILAGRDLTEGGTWLGMTRRGRLAALTNFRDGQRRAHAPSRGRLVSDILHSNDTVPQTLAYLREAAPAYNPFNIVFSDGERLGIYESVLGQGRELGPGIYGLSNHVLDTPWPKVSKSKSGLAAALADDAAILRVLRDDRVADDADLPQTGVRLDWERLLSSAFVRADDYGTRCSTVLRIDRARRVTFNEWSWDRAGHESGRKTFNFEIEGMGREASRT